MSDLIDREALLRQIDIDSEGEPGYYGDTWKFIDTIKSMPPAEHGTNLAEVGTDCISRQAVLNGFCHSCDGWSCNPNTCCKTEWIRKLPVIQPGRKECEEREQGKCPWYAG